MIADKTLSRSEAHDLSVLIGARTKVLKAHVAEQAAACLADFEKKLAAKYSFDQDATWKAAYKEADRIVAECQAKIAERCEQLGIPREFAPGLSMGWYQRGENAVASRRAELRRIATTELQALSKAAITKIEKQGLNLRTQVVTMGLLSADAKSFLESLVPVEEAMSELNFGGLEQKLLGETTSTGDDDAGDAEL